MNHRVELGLTLLVSAVGASYFTWRAIQAEGNRRLTYGALLIVGVVVAYHAIKDIFAKERQAKIGSDAAQGPPDAKD